MSFESIGHQESHFSSQLRKALESNEGKAMMLHVGRTPGSIGAHSIRKGAATFACSGSTAAPSHAAISVRAGWTMGSVKDRYIKFAAAADCYLGRVLAGMDVCGVNFGVLPPHFDPHKLVESDLWRCFPAFKVLCPSAFPF